MAKARVIRDYQAKAVEAALNAINNSSKRILISMPQGTGKLFVITQIMIEFLNSNSNKKILFVSSTNSVLDQAKSEISEALKQIDVAIIKDPTGARMTSGVELTTLQNLISNELNFFTEREPSEYALVILYDSDSLGLGEPTGRIAGFLTQLDQSVKIGIDSFIEKSRIYFGDPVFTYSWHQAIQDKRLLPLKITEVTIKLTDDDFSNSDAKQRIQEIAEAIYQISRGEKTIVYAKSHEEAFQLSAEINNLAKQSNYSIPFVSTGVNNPSLIPNFQNTPYPILITNVEMLSSGYNLPNVRHIAFTRKVNSVQSFMRCVAVGMLVSDNKTELNIIDCVGLKSVIYEVSGTVPLTINDSSAKLEQPETKNSKTSKYFSETEILLRDKNSVDGVIGVKTIASELVKVIRFIPNEQGKMIGIFGRWGRGKTFAMNEIWKSLKLSDNVAKIEFHAWKYQDTPAIWAYLFEQFADAYFKTAKTILGAFFRRVLLNVKRIGWSEIFYFLVSFGLSVSFSFGLSFSQKWDLLNQIISSIGIGVVINIIIIYFRFEKTARGIFRKYYEKVSFGSLLGVQAEVQKELKFVLRAWKVFAKGQKLILFVDDIDRCSEEKIIQIIDSLRVMLEDEEIGEDLVVISAIDERILKRAIKAKYHKLVELDRDERNSLNLSLNNLTKEYIDKLFILGVRLGDLSLLERQEYFMELTKNDREAVVSKGMTPSVSLLENVADVLNEGTSEEKTVTLDQNASRDKNIKTSSPETKESLNTPSKLSPDEISLFNECLTSFKDATPRQIRIFYFRYLFAKNILTKKYESIGKQNIWLTPEMAETLMMLILKYSWTFNSDLINKHLEQVLEKTEGSIEILLLQNKFVNREDYIELLKVLDTIVAY